MKRFIPLMILALVSGHLPAAPGGGPTQFEHFITKDKDGTLRDGKAVFRYIGANMSEVTHIRTDWDLVQGDRFRLPTTDELDWMVDSAAQANFKVIRTWCFPSHLQPENPPATWYFSRNDDGGTVTLNEQAFRLFDYFLKRCAEKGVRAQVPFVYLYKIKLWSDANGDPHPQLLDFVAQVLNRVNSLTGVRYRDDKTIYCWQSGNESTPSARWIAALAAHVKRLDPNHLFMDGRWGAVDTFESYVKTSVLADDPNIDVVSFHTYGPPANGWTMSETMRRLNDDLRAHGKTMEIGEIGPATPVDTLREYLDTIVNNNIAGTSWWSWKGVRAKGGYTQWNSRNWGGNDDLKWPGFVSDLPGVAREKAKIDLLCAAAYAIRGEVRPSVLPAPTAAKLLPIADAGHISWIPGTGEQTADIERSTSSTAGFVVVSESHETWKGSAYDLFCDTGVAPGSTYFYRVRSRNTGGAAPYSNVVGPVVAQQSWLVDDLWDFKLMQAHTAAAMIVADYDLAPYHADLAVLKANADNQNILYGVAGPIDCVRIITNTDTTTLSVDGSADGREYRSLAVRRKVFPPLHVEFTGHPRVLYEADCRPTDGIRLVRINFGVADVISRVEIAYNGAKK